MKLSITEGVKYIPSKEYIISFHYLSSDPQNQYSSLNRIYHQERIEDNVPTTNERISEEKPNMCL